MDNMRHLIRLLIAFLLLVGDAIGLKNLKITVPRMVHSGDSVLLTCNYDLEGKLLYTVKWYVDEAEFYRFAPKKEPPGLVLPVRNINVNLTISNKNKVVLLNMSKKQSGLYKCEATEELPTLETKTDTAPMTVVDVPQNDPTILVERQRLPVGETLRANCTSGSSLPAPTITWTLNGEPINNVTIFYKEYSRNIKIDDESTLSRSYLEISMTSEVFQEGRLVLKCLANIPLVYKASAEVGITEDVPFIASITGDASPHSHRTNGCWPVRLSQSLKLATLLYILLAATSLR